jgi:hypothetical protein
MNLRRVIRFGFALVVGAAVIFDLLVTIVLRDRFYELYTGRLDAWVANGGPQDEIQSGVIPDCHKLAVTQAGPLGAPMLLFDRAEYDFRSDVCLQITVNRVYPQPRLQDPEIVAMICSSANDLFRRLCRGAGLQ